MAWLLWLSGLLAVVYLLRHLYRINGGASAADASAQAAPAASDTTEEEPAAIAPAQLPQHDAQAAAPMAPEPVAEPPAVTTHVQADGAADGNAEADAGADASAEPRESAAPSPAPSVHTHRFDLFGTEAELSWTPGEDEVQVRCMSRYSKGKAQSKVEGVFTYHLKQKKWDRAPRGAARDVVAEIERVCS